MDKEQVIRRMCRTGLLPVFRTSDVRNIVPASLALHAAGVACLEYTLTMPGALDLIRAARAALPRDVPLGAGTVLDAGTVDRAVRAGASFIAGPGFSAEVVAACRRHGVVSVAGAITPTEVMQALKAGADVIKVFPAPSVGSGFFREILGPFPETILMAAGGMSPANLGEYLAAGAQIITCLANGIAAEAYTSGDFPKITRAARTWLAAIRKARQGETHR